MIPENEELAIIPNQNGDFRSYKELMEEKNISQKFKDMMKNLFSHDVSKDLKHKKVNFQIQKEFSINDKICVVINDGFSEKAKNKIEKAKTLIQFIPVGENEKVKKFSNCYKKINKLEYEEEILDIHFDSLWDKAIEILITETINVISKDGTVKRMSERIQLDEEQTYDLLNTFYEYAFGNKISYKKFIPNELGEFCYTKDIFITDDIDEDLKEIFRLILSKGQKDYSELLLNKNVKINNYEFQKKTIKEISKEIDFNIKIEYKKLKLSKKLNKNENEDSINIDEKLKEACKKLIIEWFPNNEIFVHFFEYVNKHKIDILLNVILDKESKNNIMKGMNKDPSQLMKYLSNYVFSDENSFSNFLYSEGNSFFNIFAEMLDQNVDQINNINQMFMNNSELPTINDTQFIQQAINEEEPRRNNIRNNSRSNRRINFNNLGNIFNFVAQFDVDRKNAFIGQAYAYEYLSNLNIFQNVNWVNKVDERTNISITLPTNNHQYFLNDKQINYDIEITTNEGRIYFIKVKSSKMPSQKFNIFLSINQWNRLYFHNNQMDYLLALVSLRSITNPEIVILGKNNLNTL